MNPDRKMCLDRMCRPRGLAVCGAVNRAGTFANMILTSHIGYGYKGRLYPVSPRGGEVAGLKIYRSVAEIKGPVDLASISVPIKAVLPVLRECLDIGVAGVQLHSSGFAETGDPLGKALQDEIADIAGQGLRVLGPNCFGLHCPAGGITLLPGFDYSQKPGPAGLVAQSGGVANDFAHECRFVGLGVSKVLSFGNGCDLETTELLEYLGQDDETRYIALYVEGVRHPRQFLATLKEVSRRKPVVVWKGGLTPWGRKAALSHTGSLSGDTDIWLSALSQTNALPVQGIDEVIDALVGVSYLKKRGRRIALAGGGGAIGVFSSDLAYRYGLDLPTFSPETQARLEELFPTPGHGVVNPLDTGNPFLSLDLFGRMLREIMIREPIDVMVPIMVLNSLEVEFRTLQCMAGNTLPPRGAYLEELLTIVSDLKEETGKDVVMVFDNRSHLMEHLEVEAVSRDMRGKFQARGIPVFPNTTRALRAIKYASILGKAVTPGAGAA